MKKKVYFTFRVGNAGVTDLLTQFSAWYKLGRSLGYQYVYQPMECGRSGQEVLVFLGFEAIWKDHPPYPGPPGSKVKPWFPTELRFPYSLGFAALQMSARRKVRRLARNIGSDSVLVEFSISNPGEHRGIFELIERSVPSLPDNIDLRQSYFARRSEDPRPDPFGEADCKVLVHIRQGDATVLPTPWGTLLSVKDIMVAEFTNKGESLGDLPDDVLAPTSVTVKEWVKPDDYFDFLPTLIEDNPNTGFSFVVSSDGFTRTFDHIRKAAPKLNLTPTRLAQLTELELTHESSEFQKLASLENVRLVLGETDGNLFELIHAALTADVIITSRQQRMMLNLLGLYGREENPPLLVVLNNGGVDPAELKQLLGNKVRDVISVNQRDTSRTRVVIE